MDNIVMFSLYEKIEYCSVKLNNNDFKNNVGMRIEPSIGEGFLNALLQSLQTDLCYIVDFLDWEGAIECSDLILGQLMRSNIIILAKGKHKEAFESKGLGSPILIGDKEKNSFYFSNTKTRPELCTYMKLISAKIGNKDFTTYIKQFILARFFYQDIKSNPIYSFDKGNLKYLESSNVYVNKYINVKSIFLHYNYMMLVVKSLKELIKSSFKVNISEVSLLGVNNTGIVLANILSYELNLSVQSLNRLGPVYCLRDKVDRLDQFSGKKYIFVSDVICMGGEYKMANGIVDVLGSKLIGGVCVVKIRDVYRNNKEKKIFALLEDINEFEIDGKTIDYRVFIDDIDYGGVSNV